MGHDLADLIVECNGLVCDLEEMTEGETLEYIQAYRRKTIQAKAKRFAKLGATVDAIERDINAMSVDPMTTWDQASLPVTDELWVK